jgi:tRNA pseudouridine55 synthase
MDGVINFLKPPGMTSNTAVVLIRKHFGVKKVGHAGTLDPGACGVLPICVGKATRISAYMMDAQKEYVAEVTFGKRTDTGDSYGNVIETSSIQPPSQQDVIRALQGFTGRIKQQTPAYSAAKVEGKKRYELARKGAELPQQLREVEVYEIEYLGQTGPDAHRFRVLCGKGTYIRTLCEDIGYSLGQCATLSFLARTQCARLSIAESVTLDELKNGIEALLPLEPFLEALPRVNAPVQYRSQLFNGIGVPVGLPDIQTARIYAGDEFMGIGSVQESAAKIHTRLVDI